MKNSFVAFAALLCLCFLLTTSCNKENNENNLNVNRQGHQATENVEYFFDGEKVTEDRIDFYDENIEVAITDKEDGTGLEIWGFTSKQMYIEWGEKRNFPVKIMLEIEEHLRNYIETNKVVEIFEETGVVPQWYLDYEKSYYQQMTKHRNVEDRGTAILHKADCGDSNDGTSPLHTTLPVMWPGWNNETSAYFPISLYSGLSIYDRWFYGTRMATLWNVGWTTYCFDGPYGVLNDRMSSAILL